MTPEARALTVEISMDGRDDAENMRNIAAAIRAAVEEEREACAMAVEAHKNPYLGHDCYDDDCKPVIAAEIRARKNA